MISLNPQASKVTSYQTSPEMANNIKGKGDFLSEQVFTRYMYLVWLNVLKVAALQQAIKNMEAELERMNEAMLGMGLEFKEKRSVKKGPFVTSEQMDRVNISSIFPFLRM